MFDRILIFGYGTMASAMLEGWLASGLEPGRFTVYNPRTKPVPVGVRFATDLPNSAHDAVVLGVKPQMLANVAGELAGYARQDTVLISMLAAIDLSQLALRMPSYQAIVRLMPNLAVAIGQSATALVERGLSPSQRALVTDLATRLGTAEWLSDETRFDLVTALAGSGPGFVYRFIDALAGGAARLGLDPEQGERLAKQVVAGAAALALQSPHAPAELARRVASPGGTTQRGLDVLDADGGLETLVTGCLAATRDRARELAGDLSA